MKTSHSVPKGAGQAAMCESGLLHEGVVQEREGLHIGLVGLGMPHDIHIVHLGRNERARLFSSRKEVAGRASGRLAQMDASRQESLGKLIPAQYLEVVIFRIDLIDDCVWEEIEAAQVGVVRAHLHDGWREVDRDELGTAALAAANLGFDWRPHKGDVVQRHKGCAYLFFIGRGAYRADIRVRHLPEGYRIRAVQETSGIRWLVRMLGIIVLCNGATRLPGGVRRRLGHCRPIRVRVVNKTSTGKTGPGAERLD
eukprot:scaffold268527_cov36-Tisochrysis_lutea.AAC.3